MDELKKLFGEMQTALVDYRTKNDQRIAQLESKAGAADPVTVEGMKKAGDAIAKLEAKQTEIVAALNARANERKGDETPKELVEHKAAFQAWARSGGRDEGLAGKLRAAESKAIEAKAMSVGSNPDGGFLVPVDTNGRLVKKVYETSMMRQVCSVQTISSDKLEGTYDLDEGSAAWEDEQGTGATDGATPTVGKWTIQTHVLKSRVRATQQLLDDAVFDVEAWLADKNAGKQERTEAAAFLSGNGVGKPRGILTYPSGTAHKQIEQVLSGTSAKLQKADLSDSADFFLRIIYALKAPYLSGSSWGLSREGRLNARLIKNTQGNYVWVDQFNGGQGTQTQPATLFGFPVTIMDDLPAFAANSLSILFGNFREAYQIVDRAGIRVLRDPYTAEPFVKFITSRRVGGDVVNFEAIKIGKLA
jgi:HK97 family phage major capsid protein